MKNKELLSKIYYQTKSINKNLQRLANIGLLSILTQCAKEVKDEEDTEGKKLVKLGLKLIAVSEILIMISDFVDHCRSNKEN